MGNDRSDWRKKLTDIQRMGQPTHLIIKLPPLLRLPLVNIHMDYKYLHSFRPFRDGLYADLFLGPPCHYLSNNVPFKSLPTQPNHCPQPMNQHRLLHLYKRKNSRLSEQQYILDHQNRVMMALQSIPRLESIYRPRSSWMKWRPGPLRKGSANTAKFLYSTVNLSLSLPQRDHDLLAKRHRSLWVSLLWWLLWLCCPLW